MVRVELTYFLFTLQRLFDYQYLWTGNTFKISRLILCFLQCVSLHTEQNLSSTNVDYFRILHFLGHSFLLRKFIMNCQLIFNKYFQISYRHTFRSWLWGWRLLNIRKVLKRAAVWFPTRAHKALQSFSTHGTSRIPVFKSWKSLVLKAYPSPSNIINPSFSLLFIWMLRLSYLSCV